MSKNADGINEKKAAPAGTFISEYPFRNINRRQCSAGQNIH